MALRWGWFPRSCLRQARRVLPTPCPQNGAFLPAAARAWQRDPWQCPHCPWKSHVLLLPHIASFFFFFLLFSASRLLRFG